MGIGIIIGLRDGMALLEKNAYLFNIGDGQDFNMVVREFMIADEKYNFRFLNVVYDMEDFKKYR